MAKILIIDDEPDFSEMLAFRIEKSTSNQVFRSIDGEDGLKQVKEIHPDLIILDVMMPKMDGLEVIKVLKEDASTRTIPVIILTASVSPSTINTFFKEGVFDFVIKPFEPADLLTKIDQALKKAADDIKQ